jgi:hypothetical protein
MVVKKMSEATTVTIDTFLGVNKSLTETLLKLGEASEMSNWLITDDKKLMKQFGYVHINNSGGPVRGIWNGTLSGNDYLVYARGGHLYSHNLETHADSDLGTLADNHTTFFATNNTLYIMDGTEFYSWTGTGSIATVTGYVPTVFTAAPPTGGGTALESINYLTGKKIMKFSGDNTAKVYQLPEYAINSVDSVIVNGVAKTETTDYTVNLTNGTVTFVSAPTTGVNNVVIGWNKNDAAARQKITKNLWYGGSYYARHWIFGNPDYKNTRFCSGVTMAGVSDPTYWPMFADSDVGEHAITDIKTQYDKQIIFTTGDSSGASAWYSTEEDYIDPNSGITTALFPVYPINAKVGNVAPGQVQIIMNNPYTIWKGVFEWESTYVMNEKNARWISQRIQRDIDIVNLANAITWDWDDKGLYMLCVGQRIWVYNYRIDAWYILDLPHTPTCFAVIDQELYFGTTSGYIMKFDEDILTYDGEPIEAVWEMGYYNFGADWLRKFIQRIFISILPMTKTHVDVSFKTDRLGMSKTYIAAYGISTFDHMDFAHFSFATNYSPQPFKFKIRAKKIDYFKIVLRNDGADSASVLSITLPVRTGGEVRQRI